MSEILSCLIYKGFNGYLKQLKAKRPKLKAVSYGRLVTQRSETLVSARDFYAWFLGPVKSATSSFIARSFGPGTKCLGLRPTPKNSVGGG